MKKALLVIDIQRDFCPGGSLAVDKGDEIIDGVNSIMNQYDIVVATQDFHPANHSSFVSNSKNGIWPDHCVQGTKGAEFHPFLNKSEIDIVFPKGTSSQVDSYSGFFDNDKKSSTGLGEFLKKQGITHVDVVGLALDYCVKATALDSHSLGFKTRVLTSLTKAVNLNKGDDIKALEELYEAGISVSF